MRQLCTDCLAVTEPKTEKGGSGCFEVLLWVASVPAFFFGGGLLPLLALVYSVLIRGARRKICAACGSPLVVPLKSRTALELLGPERVAAEIEAARQDAEDRRTGGYVLAGILAVFVIIALLAR